MKVRVDGERGSPSTRTSDATRPSSRRASCARGRAASSPGNPSPPSSVQVALMTTGPAPDRGVLSRTTWIRRNCRRSRASVLVVGFEFHDARSARMVRARALATSTSRCSSRAPRGATELGLLRSRLSTRQSTLRGWRRLCADPRTSDARASCAAHCVRPFYDRRSALPRHVPRDERSFRWFARLPCPGSTDTIPGARPLRIEPFTPACSACSVGVVSTLAASERRSTTSCRSEEVV